MPNSRQRLADPQRAGDVEPPVAFDQQVRRVADGLAHRRHAAHGVAQFAAQDVAIRAAERVPLQRLPAAGDRLRRFRGELGGRLGRHEPGVGVAAHPVAAPAAEQLPDRLLEHLALDVPAGHLQSGQRAGQHRPAAPVRVAIGVVPQRLDVQRIAAEQLRRQVLEAADHGAVVELDRRLAEAVHAGIGFDFHERQVRPVGVAEPGLDGGDFHRGSVLTVSVSPAAILRDQRRDVQRPFAPARC